jgi:hypothetical protein
VTVHDFSESLAKSQAQEAATWWGEVYARAFPSFHSMVSVRSDGWAQRGGIDRVITLKSGKTLAVDEKVRYASYGDIALERWSDQAKRTPGWVQKDLACDFIAYAFVPDCRCYLLPFISLRAAWQRFGRDWIAQAEARQGGFRVVQARNPSYVTESIAVPIPQLLSAIQAAQIVEWAPRNEVCPCA